MRSRPFPALAGLALLLPACGPSTDVRPPAGPVLPFIADDYPRALAEARERKVPLFIESWAPW